MYAIKQFLLHCSFPITGKIMEPQTGRNDDAHGGTAERTDQGEQAVEDRDSGTDNKCKKSEGDISRNPGKPVNCTVGL